MSSLAYKSEGIEPSRVLICSVTIQESFFSRAGLMTTSVYWHALMSHTFHNVRFRCPRLHPIFCQIHKLLTCAAGSGFLFGFFLLSSSTGVTVEGFKISEVACETSDMRHTVNQKERIEWTVTFFSLQQRLKQKAYAVVRLFPCSLRAGAIQQMKYYFKSQMHCVVSPVVRTCGFFAVSGPGSSWCWESPRGAWDSGSL